MGRTIPIVHWVNGRCWVHEAVQDMGQVGSWWIATGVDTSFKGLDSLLAKFPLTKVFLKTKFSNNVICYLLLMSSNFGQTLVYIIQNVLCVISSERIFPLYYVKMPRMNWNCWVLHIICFWHSIPNNIVCMPVKCFSWLYYCSCLYSLGVENGRILRAMTSFPTTIGKVLYKIRSINAFLRSLMLYYRGFHRIRFIRARFRLRLPGRLRFIFSHLDGVVWKNLEGRNDTVDHAKVFGRYVSVSFVPGLSI